MTKISKRTILFIVLALILCFLTACSTYLPNYHPPQSASISETIGGSHIDISAVPTEFQFASMQSTSEIELNPIDTNDVNDEIKLFVADEHILKRGMLFYQGEFDMYNITSITFTNGPPAEYDEKWSANVADTDDIAGYRVGTKVFIVGDKIYFNESSRMMFCVKNLRDEDVWASLTEVNGLDFVNTSLVTDMSYMFCGGKSFANLDIDNWDVSNVWRMKAMFAGCTNLKTLDVSNWDVGKVKDFAAMFQSTNSHAGDMKLKHIDVSKWDTSSATTMSHMFYGCAQLKEIKVDNWNVEMVTNFSHMFADCYSLQSLNLLNWETLSVGSLDAFLNDCRSLTIIDVSELETGTCVQFSQMFENCANLEEIVGMEEWDVSDANHYAFSETFHNCPKLTELDLSNWDTSNADNMARMFAKCPALRKVNLSGWNVENVETMLEMFEGCSEELEIVGINGWNMEGIDTTNMF